MKTLLFTIFFVLSLTSMSGQIASNSGKTELIPTKKIEKVNIQKKKKCRKIHCSLKKIVKLIRKEDEEVKG